MVLVFCWDWASGERLGEKAKWGSKRRRGDFCLEFELMW